MSLENQLLEMDVAIDAIRVENADGRRWGKNREVERKLAFHQQ